VASIPARSLETVMDDTTIRISCAQNGYIIEVTDPDIKKQNQKRDMSLSKNGADVPWRDPHVKFTFKSPAEVAKFITTNIDRMFPDSDEYSTAFDLEVAKDSKS
jgi:hypothetical protein